MNRDNNSANMNQDNTEDEITSFHDEDEENILYMHKKELVHLEGDKSIEIENSYDVDHTYSNHQEFNFKEAKDQQQQQQQRNKKQLGSNELMKFISDSSEFYERPNQILQSIPTKIEENYFQPSQYQHQQQQQFLRNPNTFLAINSFEYFIFGNDYKPLSIASFNQSGPSFKMSMSKELEGKYKELKNEHDQVLALLQHWQKFYIDIVGLLNSQNTIENVDYFSQAFQDSVIEELKTMIKIAKEKEMLHSISFANKLFEFIHEHSFNYQAKTKEYNWTYYRMESLSMSYIKKDTLKSKRLQTPSKVRRIESLMFEITSTNPNSQRYKVKSTPRNYEATDGLNSLPPVQFNQKKINVIHIGTQTIDNKEKEKDKESLIEIHQFKVGSLSQNQPIKLTIITKKEIKMILKAECRFQFITKVIPKQFQLEETQTDLTQKAIESMNTSIKESSNKVKQSQIEKDQLKEYYEEKISTLNGVIEESKQQQNQLNTSIVDPIANFLPELIPPEQTYKIFIYCVKHFKYEEELYKKFMEEADLKCLKTFVIKMDNYIMGTSIPCSRQIIPSSKKYKESILTGIKPLKYSNTHEEKRRSGSNKLHQDTSNNSTFSKYKAVLKNLKNK